MTQTKTNVKFIVTHLAAILFAALFLTVIHPLAANAAANGFRADGTTIKDANGNSFVMRRRRRSGQLQKPDQTRYALL